MTRTLLLSLMLAFAGQAGAATVTVRITATVLAPANISYPLQKLAAAEQDAPLIQSVRNLQYELTRDANRVCRVANRDNAHARDLRLAQCNTVTIHFN